jgi:hypothetical protein
MWVTLALTCTKHLDGASLKLKGCHRLQAATASAHRYCMTVQKQLMHAKVTYVSINLYVQQDVIQSAHGHAPLLDLLGAQER